MKSSSKESANGRLAGPTPQCAVHGRLRKFVRSAALAQIGRSLVGATRVLSAPSPRIINAVDALQLKVGMRTLTSAGAGAVFQSSGMPLKATMIQLFADLR